MKYYRLVTESGASRLCVEVQDDRLADLTAIDGSVTGVEALAQAASAAGTDIDEVTDTILQSSRGDDFPLSDITRESSYGIGEERLGMPIVPPEIWAAGVTYRTSEMERRRESDTPDIYSKVYSAERPELFLKATPQRVRRPLRAGGHPGGLDLERPRAGALLRPVRGRDPGLHHRQRHEQPLHRGGEPPLSPPGQGLRPLLRHRPLLRIRPRAGGPLRSRDRVCHHQGRRRGVPRRDVDVPDGADLRGAWRTGSSATTWWRT